MPTPIEADTLVSFSFIPPFEDNHWLEIIDEIYYKKVYYPYLPKTKGSTVCLEVGANVGFATYYFARYFGKVYAMEPSKTHRIALERTIKEASLDNVTVLPQALSNKNGKETFVHNKNRTSFSLEKALDDGTGKEEVETITIDKVVEQYAIKQIDLLKIDPEGSESQIITSDGFAKVAPIIKVIVGEYHEWTPMSKFNFQVCLEELGFKVTWHRNTQASVYSAVRI